MNKASPERIDNIKEDVFALHKRNQSLCSSLSARVTPRFMGFHVQSV